MAGSPAGRITSYNVCYTKLLLILNELQKHNKKVFEAIFHEYHQALLRFAERIVFNKDVCEDIVQSVFISLWENAGSVEIQKSLKSWLYQAVRYKGLSYNFV